MRIKVCRRSHSTIEARTVDRAKTEGTRWHSTIPREGRDADPNLEEGHHARHCSQRKYRSPEGGYGGRRVSWSPREECRVRRHRRCTRACSACTRRTDNSSGSSTPYSAGRSRTRRHTKHSSTCREGRTAEKRKKFRGDAVELPGVGGARMLTSTYRATLSGKVLQPSEAR